MEFGIGQYAKQLAALLDIRGRVPLEVDERASPVVILGTTDVPGVGVPRQGEWVAATATSTSTGANTPKIAFRPASADRFLVLTAVFTNGTAATRIKMLKQAATGFSWADNLAAVSGGGYMERPLGQGDSGGIQQAVADTAALNTNMGQISLLSSGLWAPLPNVVVRFEEAWMLEHSLALSTFSATVYGQLFDARALK
jgi:hypothetical protein